MIPQPFVRGGTERVFFGPYEYPAGADLIYDFGNPLCTSGFTTGSWIVYNVGSANVTGSLIPYNNPGPLYPTLITDNGGLMVTEDNGAGTNYLQWDWKSTVEQTNVLVYAPNGVQNVGANQYIPKTAGASSIELQIIYPNNRMLVNISNSSNVKTDEVFSIQFDTGSLNGRNGWNIFAVSANESNIHNLYVNTTTSSLDTTTITRTNSATQTTQLGLNSNARIMAFLQYPKLLTPKEIRQINKVFSQRFFT